MNNSMNDILKSFTNAENGEVVDSATGKTKQSPATAEKNAIKALLEGLDSAQRSVNQMPSTHKMAKNTASKHPAGKFLVGGEDGEPDAGDEVVAEAIDSPRSVAIELKQLYDDNENDVQRIADDSPEFYRAIMYTLYPRAKDIDGTKDYWDIVDQLESLFLGEEPQKTFEEGEVDTGGPEVTPEDIIAAWNSEFPHSSAGLGKAFGGGYAFKFRLAKDKSEVASGIMENDPLMYTAFLNLDGTWEESHTYMHVAPPEGSHLVFSSVKFRKKTMKNVTLDKIQKRFKQVKSFVAANADQLHRINFDISEKLGGAVAEAKFGDKAPASDVHKKQSLGDIFRSMEEEQENPDRELYGKTQKQKASKKGDNGKSELAEVDATSSREAAMYDLMATIKNLRHFSQSIEDIAGEFDVNNGATFIAIAKKIVAAVKDVRSASK